MNKPLVTVLMALYNGEAYLKQTLQSVLNQTYSNFEFLIINDCSTDHSLEIIESFHDERIRVHTNAQNLGQTRSLNRGLALARGDYFARMDGDDLALAHWLQAQTDYVQQHPHYSVVSSYALAVDEKNKIKKLYKPPESREDIILRSLIASPIHHVGSILKKKDIIESGGYDEQYIFAMDYELWERLVKRNFQITTNPKILVAIREHEKSISRSEQGRAAQYDRRDLKETKEIAARNIQYFVDGVFSDHDISLFCRANYDEGNLTLDEFNQAMEVTKKIYGNVTSSLNISHEKKNQWTQQRCVTLYLKRIFALISRKEYNAVRKISLRAIRDVGPSVIFILLWMGSFFKGIFLNFIPGLYQKMLRRKALREFSVQPRYLESILMK